MHVNTPVQWRLAKNGRVNSFFYHGHRNIYLLRMRRRPHALLFINKWVDQGAVYPFDYPVIRPASRTKVVWIIEVLL